MDGRAAQSRNEEWLRPLEPARRKRNLGAVRLARRPNVSLIWHANPDCQTGSNLRSPNDNRKDDAPTLPPDHASLMACSIESRPNRFATALPAAPDSLCARPPHTSTS